MLRKITLKNFMSHTETTIELADGLTVLTGPNNCGKSAIVAALQTLASNGRTKHVRRHGEKTASVSVETSEGDCITWERKGNTVKYVINGEDIHRVGQNTPDGLHEILKLDRIDLGTGKAADRYDIHFGEQKAPVFLLGDTGSRAAQFFASSSDVSRLMEMQALHRAQVRDQKKEKKRLEKESKENLARLSALNPIKSINKSVLSAESIAASIASQTEQSKQILELIQNIERKRAECKTLEAHSETLNLLDQATTSPMDLELNLNQCLRLRKLTENIRTKIRLKRKLSADQTTLQSLRPVPIQHPLQRAHRLAENLGETRQRIDRLARATHAFGTLTSPPQINPEKSLRQMLDRLRIARRSLSKLLSSSQITGNLQPLPELRNVDQLHSLVTRLKTSAKQCRDAQMIAKTAEADLQRCVDSIETFVRENPKCAVCGGELDPATLMSTASRSHSHHPSHSPSEDGMTQ